MASKMMENVKTVNSAVRTSMMVAVAGGMGYVTWFGYSNYVVPGIEAKQAISDLQTLREEYEVQSAQLKVAEAENDRLETTMKLLKIDQRVANLEVMEKGVDDRGKPYLEVRFTEVDEYGNPAGASRDYTLQGNMFFIDTWVAKFEDRYIEQSDGLRGVSLFKFKRIYGDDEKPSEAQSLDISSGDVPDRYRDQAVTDFERAIWSDFDAVCNDLSRQKELGIRAIHGQANYLPPEEGRTYQVRIRSTGDVSLTPLERKTDADSYDEQESQVQEP